MGKVFWKTAGLLLITGIFLAGCGVKIPESITETSVVIDSDGTVKAYIIEPFEKDKYLTSELAAMAEKEAKEYCEKYGEGKVILETVELLENDSSTVRVVFSYASAQDYSAYNEGTISFGQVKDFGQSLTGVKSVKDGTAADLTALSEHHVVITNEKAHFYCPYNVIYASDGVVIDADGAADTNGCNGSAVLILKK